MLVCVSLRVHQPHLLFEALWTVLNFNTSIIRQALVENPIEEKSLRVILKLRGQNYTDTHCISHTPFPAYNHCYVWTLHHWSRLNQWIPRFLDRKVGCRATHFMNLLKIALIRTPILI